MGRSWLMPPASTGSEEFFSPWGAKTFSWDFPWHIQGYVELISFCLTCLTNLGLFSFWIPSPRSLSLQAHSFRDLLRDRYSITDSLLSLWNWAPLPCHACWNPFHENRFKRKVKSSLAKCIPKPITGAYLKIRCANDYKRCKSLVIGRKLVENDKRLYTQIYPMLHHTSLVHHTSTCDPPVLKETK